MIHLFKNVPVNKISYTYSRVVSAFNFVANIMLFMCDSYHQWWSAGLANLPEASPYRVHPDMYCLPGLDPCVNLYILYVNALDCHCNGNTSCHLLPKLHLYIVCTSGVVDFWIFFVFSTSNNWMCIGKRIRIRPK
jgi:hypothetical protein